MENVEMSETTIASPADEINAKHVDNSECKVQGAVDIVDHYAMQCDRKTNECSDSTQPQRPPRKYSDYAIDSLPSSRKGSENLDVSPMKPSRKLSQTSANRKFSTTSETASIKTPKKVSFSDELPLAAMQLAALTMDSDNQTNSDYLNTLTHAIMDNKMLESIQHSSDEEDDDHDDNNNDDDNDNDNDEDDKEDDTDHYSSPSSSISTQTLNELTKEDMFPNSRKVSLHSERSFNMSAGSSILKPGTESATTQITTESEIENERKMSITPMDTFLENERKMSTGSIKSNLHQFRFNRVK